MPIRRVDSSCSVNVSKRKNSKLFKRAEKLQETCCDTGSTMLKNVKLSPVVKFVFNVLDKINSKMTNHQKVCKVLIGICEKFIRNTGSI